MKPITFIDLFSGVGGFHYGLEKANQTNDVSSRQLLPQSRRCKDKKEASHSNSSIITSTNRKNPREFRCVWANENNPYAASIYRKNFPETPLNTDDIRLVKADDIPEADLLCAGFPCQPFSISGRRKGFEEARGNLFYEICRIARDKGIPHLLLENVKGLLSSEGGYSFWHILNCLDELGYDLSWQVLNSKDFEVPQNRERVFIVGHLGGECAKEVFPLGQCVEKDIGGVDGQINTKTKVMEYVKNNIEVEGDKYRNANGETIAFKGACQAQDGSRFPLSQTKIGDKGNGVFLAQLSNTLQRTKEQQGILEKKDENEHEEGQEGRKNLREDGMESGRFLGARPASAWGSVYIEDEASGTLTTKQKDRDGAVIMVLKNGSIRRLTPTEAERLQGFPDFFTAQGIDKNGKVIDISDSQRYKCLGNAVSTPVITAIGKRLGEVIEAGNYV